MRKIGLFLLLCCLFGALNAQTFRLYGDILDNQDSPIPFITIQVTNTKLVKPLIQSADQDGRFNILVPEEGTYKVIFTGIGYLSKAITVQIPLSKKLSVILEPSNEELGPIEVEARRKSTQNMTRIDAQVFESFSNASGDVGGLIKGIGLGVSSAGGELSGQYAVRGGNFDENLVYVNDFEIYRPQLTRSGQQEGLSFVFPQLVSSLEFSSGGFASRFGDKLSSVLNVRYKQVDSFETGGEIGFLGTQVYLNSPIGKHTSIASGVRYKTNRLLLQSLETNGEYNPFFADAQFLIHHQWNKNWASEFLGHYSQNLYRFSPESATTNIGTILSQVLELRFFFEGQQRNNFQTAFGGISSTYSDRNDSIRLKFMLSTYRSLEIENFDVIGDYFIYEVDKNLGSETAGEAQFQLGYGTYHNYGRNYLDVLVSTLEHKGFLQHRRGVSEWGAGVKIEDVRDNINDWNRQDSALFTLPDTLGAVELFEVTKSQNTLTSFRPFAYYQYTHSWNDIEDRIWNINAGLRGSYWTVNKETFITPRVQLTMKPDAVSDWVFSLASGLYYQPPFYRELRNNKGVLNKELRAQKSAHITLGSDKVFNWMGRPFRWITEIYGKYLWDVVPYDIEDVRIRYQALNNARGRVYGIDTRINGEFVPGVESWLNMSILSAEENLFGDSTLYSSTEFVGEPVEEIGFIPRPTDQRFRMNILFQDYLPNFNRFQTSLNLVFGTGLPFGPPENQSFRNQFRNKPYRRVDLGFMYDLKNKDVGPEFLKEFKSVQIAFDVFNLLGVKNVLSQIWVEDISGTQYAFENKLTNRRLNLILRAKF